MNLRPWMLAALLACAPAAHADTVMIRALERGQHVALFHIEGRLPAGAAAKLALEKLAGSAPGAEKGSVRVSMASASLSIAFDPKLTQVVDLEKDIERRFAARKLSLLLLQVVDREAVFGSSIRASAQSPGRGATAARVTRSAVRHPARNA
jgi:hypothetical protein